MDVADLQTDVEIEDGVISGSLSYVADYSAAGYEDGGNFLALKVGSSESVSNVTYVVTFTDGDGESQTATLDEDLNVIIPVTDPETQIVTVTASKEGYVTDEIALSLTGLTLEDAPEETDDNAVEGGD